MDRTCHRGFTIIELMIVIAVMGALATIALPAFSEMVKNSRRVTAVNDFLSSLHIARSAAITDNQRVTICRANTALNDCVGTSGGWRNGWLVFRDLNGDGALDADDTLLTTGGPLRPPFNMFSAEFTTHMTFQPSGRMRAASTDTFGEMLLCEDGVNAAPRVIIVERTGRPRVDTVAIGGAVGDCS